MPRARFPAPRLARLILPRRRSRYDRPVKRALAWLAGLVGIAALGRMLAKRRHPAASDEEQDAASTDPAEQLRRTLAGQRQTAPDVEPEPKVDPAAAPELLEERGAGVHAKAREAIDAMSDSGEAP